jgi:hypothetical protein
MQKLIASLLIAGVMSTRYTQYNSHPFGKCSGQPVTMSASKYGACELTTTADSTCTEVTGIYQSQKVTCSDSPLNLNGIVQDFVARYSYTDTEKCSTDPSSVDAVVADAGCHPSSATKGVTTQWISANCNGGNPYFRTCIDAACTSCTEDKSVSGECTSRGASASTAVFCVKGGKLRRGNNSDDFDNMASNSFRAVMLGALPAIVMMA